jgi:hypothetical protein
MTYAGSLAVSAYNEASNFAGFVDDTSTWFGHAFKLIKIAPQYMPNTMVTEKGKDAFDQFGTLGGVFLDLPGLIGDVEELARDVGELVGRVFSGDVWFKLALSARNVASGVVHSIVDLGLGGLVPFAEATEAWFTMSDGVNMFASEKNAKMEMLPFVCKMGLAVGVFSLGYFSIAGTLTGSQMLYLSTFTAGCGLAQDIAEI